MPIKRRLDCRWLSVTGSYDACGAGTLALFILVNSRTYIVSYSETPHSGRNDIVGYACIFEALQNTAIDTSKKRHMDALERSSLQQGCIGIFLTQFSRAHGCSCFVVN
jgi:hypothetical protein